MQHSNKGTAFDSSWFWNLIAPFIDTSLLMLVSQNAFKHLGIKGYGLRVWPAEKLELVSQIRRNWIRKISLLNSVVPRTWPSEIEFVKLRGSQLSIAHLPSVVTSLTVVHNGSGTFRWDSVVHNGGSLPFSLLELKMKGFGTFPIIRRLPSMLMRLRLPDTFNCPLHDLHLPDSLTNLRLGDCFNQPICKDDLPVGLSSLRIGVQFRHNLSFLSALQALTELRMYVDCPVRFSEKIFPASLLKLTLKIRCVFDSSAPCFPLGVLPATLTHCCLLGIDSFTGTFPPSVRFLQLEFPEDFHQEVVCPPKLEVLEVYGHHHWYLRNDPRISRYFSIPSGCIVRRGPLYLKL